MVSLIHYLGLSAILFALGLAGLLIHRHSLLHLLMCIELLFLAINTQFIALGHYSSQLSGQIMVFFVLAVTAAETAVALAILVLLFRDRGTIEITSFNHLKG